MKKSNFFLIYILLNMMIMGFLGLHAAYRQQNDMVFLKVKSALVRQLDLTDLCLFTEANYTRNPSQADLHTPFQDSPFSLEHFPSGSIVGPPPGFKR